MIKLLSIFLSLPFVCFAQHKATMGDRSKIILHNNHTWSFADSISAKPKPAFHLNDLEIPALNKGEELIRHSAYSLIYSEPYEQAKWVAYQLTASETQKEFERTNRFIPDPEIATGSAEDEDYKGSGYDRGHLAPASDMGWSAATMAESFYYSNMSPQVPSFNRGIWKKGEDRVRQWANEYSSIYIVVGPVLKSGLPTIGSNKVAVPQQYFKVLLDYEGPETKAIAFLMANEGSRESLQSFVVSVDSVEKLTGIDFFPTLPDYEEKRLESSVCISCWTWTNAGIGGRTSTGTGTTSKTHSSTQQSTGSTQCLGTTKKGNRCLRKTRNANGYCAQHVE